jgi:hypothetical protein
MGIAAKSSANPRRKRRPDAGYAVQADVEYRILEGGKVTEEGCGRTLTMSNESVLFEAGHSLPVARHIELSIAWPGSLGLAAGLALRVTGQTVRATGNQTGVSIETADFQTHIVSKAPREGPIQELHAGKTHKRGGADHLPQISPLAS